MFRRKRRRSAFSRRHPERRFVALGAAAVILIGLFVFLIRQADVLAPAPSEIRVEATDLIKE